VSSDAVPDARFHNAEAERASGETIRFSFGRNWRKYLNSLSPGRLAQARESLAASLSRSDLDGLTFIDAGCGSGVFSLSALDLGAKYVTSIDIDPSSVACARDLCARSPRADDWTIRQGSVLDSQFIDALEPADIVYSWGVLHHTGAMWTAIDNAMRLVAPGGLLCLALYREPRHAGLHLALKRAYNRAPSPGRFALLALYCGILVTHQSLATRTPPWEYVAEYGRQSRGMSLVRDVEDWLGGLPCDYATPEGIDALAVQRGFVAERTIIAPRGGNNEYLLRRTGGDVSHSA